MIGLLHAVARHASGLLVLGLLIGILVPDLARAMVPMIFPMVVFLLFLSTLRVDVVQAFAAWGKMPGYLGVTLVMQIGLPLLAIAVLGITGGLSSILGIGVVLVLAAAPLSGSPGLTLMVGGNPAPALRQLIIGTVLLPVTVLPVFWLMPVFGSPLVVGQAAVKLLGVIAVAGGFGLLLRQRVDFFRTDKGERAVEGMITAIMALVVIGLMSAVGPALVAGDSELWATLAVVCGLNFGTQSLAFWIMARIGQREAAPALAIIAGNRNLALFLGVVPASTASDLLFFIGCYQVPMYLTPLIMAPVMRWLSRLATTKRPR